MSELEQKIKEWIGSQGYPVEMLVAKSFREAGFTATQSEYFIDPESGDTREIDVIAYKQANIGEILVRVSLCIECKVSNKHPWIMFASKDTKIAKPASIMQRPSTKAGLHFLSKISNNKYAQNTPFFKLEERNGYGLTEAFTTGKDNAYASCISVAKCARSLIEVAESTNSEQVPACVIAFPIILLQGKLFECHQDSTSLEVQEINNGTLIWRNQASNAGHSIISLYTAKSLPALIKKASKLIDFIFCQEDVFKEIQEDYLSQYKNRWKQSFTGTLQKSKSDYSKK